MTGQDGDVTSDGAWICPVMLIISTKVSVNKIPAEKAGIFFCLNMFKAMRLHSLFLLVLKTRLKMPYNSVLCIGNISICLLHFLFILGLLQRK